MNPMERTMNENDQDMPAAPVIGRVAFGPDPSESQDRRGHPAGNPNVNMQVKWPHGQQAETQAGLGKPTLRMSATFAEISAALAAAQGEIQNPVMDKTAEVRNKEGKFAYRFSYASLGSMLNEARRALSKQHIALLQGLQEGGPQRPGLVQVCTTLIHKSGEWIESVITVSGDRNDPQAFAGRQTYAKRQALQALIGITGEDDRDANEDGDADVYDRRGGTMQREAAPPRPPATSDGDISQMQKMFIDLREKLCACKTLIDAKLVLAATEDLKRLWRARKDSPMILFQQVNGEMEKRGAGWSFPASDIEAIIAEISKE